MLTEGLGTVLAFFTSAIRPRLGSVLLAAGVVAGIGLDGAPTRGAGRELPNGSDALGSAVEAELEDAATTTATTPFSLTTHAEYCQAVFEKLKADGADVYARTTTDGPQLRGDAEAWLVELAKVDADLGGAASVETLHREVDSLIERGCDHPLVIGYAGHLDLIAGRLKRSRERHDAVSAALLEGEYGSRARFYAAFRVMRLDTLWGTNGPRYKSERVAAETWLELAAEESIEPVDQRLHWKNFNYLADQAWDRRAMGEFLVAAGDDSRLSAWLQAMLAGKGAHDRAWQARGGQRAGEVEEDRWKPFHDGIAEAKGHYERAHEIDPTLPEAATELIGIANADQESDREDLRYWFDEARSAQVDYLPAYTALLWSMRPRWHGSHGAMYALANEWHEEGRFDTNGPYMTAQAVFDISSELGGLAKGLKPEPAYVLTMSAFEQMAEDPAHSGKVRRGYARPFLMTNQLGVACIAGREQDARQVLDQMLEEGIAVDDDTLRTYGLPPEIHIPRLIARTGHAAETVKVLGELTWDEKRADRDALQRTVEAYQSAKDAVDDPRTDDYFNHWLRVYSMERDWYDGKWVSPRFGPRHLDWYHPVEGLWDVEDTASAVARRSDTSATPLMWSECYLPGPYEVEVQVEPLFETGRSAWSGIHAGGRGEGKHGLYFWINNRSSTAGISPEAVCTDAARIPKKKSYKMSARVWPGYGELWIDDQLVFNLVDDDFAPSGYFGLAVVPKTGHAAEVRYRSPRFRRLAPRPKESPETSAEESETSEP